MDEYRIAVLPGDGIGPEVTDACTSVLARMETLIDGFRLTMVRYPAGAKHYADSGVSLPASTLHATIASDATLLAAMGLPSVRYPDGREIAPQVELREQLELYAGLRPIRSVRGVPGPLSDTRAEKLDLLLVRESTEGLFAARDRTEFSDDRSTATDRLVITRRGSERVIRAAFEQARQRRNNGGPGRVTCVDKANVLGSFAFFREIFHEIAVDYPDIDSDCCYVDAMALNLVRQPWEYDVIVTENMFGDILSDLGAALIGGMGMAPSADIGDRAAVFQPCHGTAPDIAGTGLANPTAMILSAAMMLAWLGDRHGNGSTALGARVIEAAVEMAFGSGALRSTEVGGTDGIDNITKRILGSLEPALEREAAR